VWLFHQPGHGFGADEQLAEFKFPFAQITDLVAGPVIAAQIEQSRGLPDAITQFPLRRLIQPVQVLKHGGGFRVRTAIRVPVRDQGPKFAPGLIRIAGKQALRAG
jgi:hypothetical protein